MQAKTRPPGGRIAARVGVALGLVAAGLVATASPSFAIPDALNITHGPSGAAQSVVLTANTGGSAAAIASAVSGTTLAAQIRYDSCGVLPNATPAVLHSTSGTLDGGAINVTPTASGADVTIPIPATLVLPSDVLVPTAVNICVYDTTSTGTLLASAAYTVSPVATPDPASAAVGTGSSIDVTIDRPALAAYPAAGAMPIVQLQAKTTTAPVCALAPMGASAPTATGTLASNTLTGGVIVVPPANIQVPTTTTLKFNTPATLVQPTSPLVRTAAYKVCVYKSDLSLLAESLPTAPFTVSGNAALSVNSGSNAGGNTITISSATPLFSNLGTVQTGSVQFQVVTAPGQLCTASTGTPTNLTIVSVPVGTGTRYVSTTKLAVTIPLSTAAIHLATSATTPYNVCVYDNATTPALVAQAYGVYTVGQRAVVASVTPSTAPAQGGSTIVVTGTNFPALGLMTAEIGGEPLQILDQTSTTFTAITPPHTPGAGFSIAVTTSGGTSETANLFTFTNGIGIVPDTAPNSKMTGTDLDIAGVGFEDLTFAAAGVSDPNSTKAHVYLVKGAYDPKPGSPATVKTNGQVTECLDVLVVSDSNILCTLYTGGNGPIAANAGRLISGCTAATNSTTTSVITAGTGCTFSAADVGMNINGAGIGASATITAVTGGNATINKAIGVAITTSTPLTLYLASTTKGLTDAVSSTANKVITTATAQFAATDVGRAIYGPGIPAGTVVTEFTDTKNIKISNTPTSALTGSATATTPLLIAGAGPVPIGTYTVTVVSNGAIIPANATPTVPPYMQSIISSGSTFTVADYN